LWAKFNQCSERVVSSESGEKYAQQKKRFKTWKFFTGGSIICDFSHEATVFKLKDILIMDLFLTQALLFSSQ